MLVGISAKTVLPPRSAPLIRNEEYRGTIRYPIEWLLVSRNVKFTGTPVRKLVSYLSFELAFGVPSHLDGGPTTSPTWAPDFAASLPRSCFSSFYSLLLSAQCVMTPFLALHRPDKSSDICRIFEKATAAVGLSVLLLAQETMAISKSRF